MGRGGGGGGGGEGELGNTKISIVYSIRMGGKNYAWGRYIHCAPSPLLYQT